MFAIALPVAVTISVALVAFALFNLNTRLRGLVEFRTLPPTKKSPDSFWKVFLFAVDRRLNSQAKEALRRFKEEERLESEYAKYSSDKPVLWHSLLLQLWLHPRALAAENRFHNAVRLARGLGCHIAKDKLTDYKTVLPLGSDAPFVQSKQPASRARQAVAPHRKW